MDKENYKEESIKKLTGAFYTTTNPFKIDIFYKWYSLIPEKDKTEILEPFAGANNIVAMIHEININAKWKCYDINPPQHNVFDDYIVEVRDTLSNFPKGYKVAITNPPYLAKNSATRSGLSFPETQHDDLYKYSLEKMLKNCDYVAAIIPESFFTQNIFHDRLYAVVSLTCKMFDDTDCPVCLALFVPNGSGDFMIYQQNRFIGNYSELKSLLIKSEYRKVNWKFNDKNGSIGLYAVDGQGEASIRFCLGESIDSDRVKTSSRAITRISGLPDDVDIEKFIEKCNDYLKDYRIKTKDVFLTSYRGLRKDNQYRRRMDFATAKEILNKTMELFEEEVIK